MNRTHKEVLGLTEPLYIVDLLEAASLPMECLRLRFVYDKEGIHDITCTLYIYRGINSLHPVHDNNTGHPYKSTDRLALNKLKKQQGDCDEVFTACSNHLTDTSYTNIAFYDGEQRFTPSTPLLRDTMCQQLLDYGPLQEREIMVSDTPSYQYMNLFNVTILLGEIVLPVDEIK